MLTVNSLVATERFGLVYLAGQTGGERAVSWIHVVDLEDPWNWIGGGTLLLTTGTGMPTGDKQADWLSEIIEAGASGLIVAPKPGAPVIESQAKVIADAHSFPVLHGDFTLKFIDIVRYVFESVSTQERKLQASVRRVFSTYSASIVRNEHYVSRVHELCRVNALELAVIDSRGNLVTELTTDREAWGANDDAAVSSHVLKSPTVPFPCELQLSSAGGESADTQIKQGVATAITLELQLQSQRHSITQQLMSMLVENITLGNISLSDALLSIDFQDFDPPAEWVGIALVWEDRSEAEERLFWASHEMIPIIGAWQSDYFVGFCTADDAVHRDIVASLRCSRAGASLPIDQTVTPMQALRQARRAARSSVDGAIRHFIDSNTLPSFMPVEPEDTFAIAQRYLGDLIRYDKKNGTELYATLKHYIYSERSATKTAAELHVHRHTLMYRLQSIEQITGISPTSSEGIASFWIAFEAANLAGW